MSAEQPSARERLAVFRERASHLDSARFAEWLRSFQELSQTDQIELLAYLLGELNAALTGISMHECAECAKRRAN